MRNFSPSSWASKPALRSILRYGRTWKQTDAEKTVAKSSLMRLQEQDVEENYGESKQATNFLKCKGIRHLVFGLLQIGHSLFSTPSLLNLQLLQETGICRSLSLFDHRNINEGSNIQVHRLRDYMTPKRDDLVSWMSHIHTDTASVALRRLLMSVQTETANLHSQHASITQFLPTR
ncbi:hypothetical protein M011DRAFT_320950 [Sporormia fimetaria CBS 119925]|uniref:Uncharacterized protein n=1 Tax=Sporormia fimetaria CBS 119925 TaxID=1340428 RepID=A0A6A6VGZ9_9PLEO|nr:hypothetical protein M011DRAFT_320950 [Sporormia fimetaria CBS 119925]